MNDLRQRQKNEANEELNNVKLTERNNAENADIMADTGALKEILLEELYDLRDKAKILKELEELSNAAEAVPLEKLVILREKISIFADLSKLRDSSSWWHLGSRFYNAEDEEKNRELLEKLEKSREKNRAITIEGD